MKNLNKEDQKNIITILIYIKMKNYIRKDMKVGIKEYIICHKNYKIKLKVKIKKKQKMEKN